LTLTFVYRFPVVLLGSLHAVCLAAVSGFGAALFRTLLHTHHVSACSDLFLVLVIAFSTGYPRSCSYSLSVPVTVVSFIPPL
jgi:hypothetical protein